VGRAIAGSNGQRREKEGIKRAKVAISVAALTITVAGWLSLHASEPPATGTDPQQVGTTSHMLPDGTPAPITSSRSSR